MTFRLLTYNIMHGGGTRVQAIAEVIKACAPDLVLLQEATDPANVEKIADAAGMADYRSVRRQSLAFMSREKVAFCEWVRPRVSRHAFIDIVPAGEKLRVFGVHLSAIHSAWTEQRRVLELRALLRKIADQRDRFHVLAGDFNTLAPGELLRAGQLPLRLRPFVWLSGGRIRWRTIQEVFDQGYVDAWRLKHPQGSGFTFPTTDPHVRLDYVFVPEAFAARVVRCEIVQDGRAAAASDHFPLLAELDVS